MFMLQVDQCSHGFLTHTYMLQIVLDWYNHGHLNTHVFMLQVDLEWYSHELYNTHVFMLQADLGWYSHGDFDRRVFVFQVDLGWYSHGEQLEHWYEIMEHPHRAADFWHAIIKTGKIAS